jgi:hypothetical protein
VSTAAWKASLSFGPSETRRVSADIGFSTDIVVRAVREQSDARLVNFWEDLMKAHIVTLASVIVAAGAGAMNAIDANGVGKEIGTLRLSDTKEGLEITPGLARLPSRIACGVVK